MQAGIDERLEQFERHLPRQAALMQLQIGADDDHRTTRIIDPFAEQILAETPLFAFQHVGKRFQRALIGAGDHPAAAAIVKQRIHRFLQHALFIADDDIRRTQFHQPLQAVIAVDDPAIKIIQI